MCVPLVHMILQRIFLNVAQKNLSDSYTINVIEEYVDIV